MIRKLILASTFYIGTLLVAHADTRNDIKVAAPGQATFAD